MEGHGGTIAVASVAGQGTTVRVTLPAREDTSADTTGGAAGVERPDALSPPPRRRASDRRWDGPGAVLAARSDGGNGTKKGVADLADRADVPRRVRRARCGGYKRTLKTPTTSVTAASTSSP